MRGYYIRSPEQKKRMLENLNKAISVTKGKPSWNKGLKMSKEFSLKISRATKGRKLSLEHRKKIGLANSAEKSYLWRGGINNENDKIRSSIEYKEWRSAVFKRDNYQCIIGGKEHGNKLQADHIKPFSLYPELRFNINNGRTLCEACHKITDTYGIRIWNYRQENNQYQK